MYVAVVCMDDDLYSHTCCYSEGYIAVTKQWCSNPVVSSIGFYCISDSKINGQSIANSRTDSSKTIA